MAAMLNNPDIAFTREVVNTITHCANILQAGNEPGPIIHRLEGVERNVDRAMGTLLTDVLAIGLRKQVQALLAEARNLQHPEAPVHTGYKSERVSTGEHHAPSYNIQPSQMQLLASLDFTSKQMAEILGVSKATINRRRRDMGFQRRAQLSDVSDEALDQKVASITNSNKHLGPNAIQARLKSEGTHVQRQRVRDSIYRVDPGGAALRSMRSLKVHRRVYAVAGPNSLWHIDGHHKLIRWKFVTHGGIDGHTRLVVFLEASDNNRKETVMRKFLHAARIYGVPSRVRADNGGENEKVCQEMNAFRGENRGSSIRGKSVHNQRIERLWKDVHAGAIITFHELFTFMELNEASGGAGILDVENHLDMWSLHYIYLPRINQALEQFRGQWNYHGVRTEKHCTPMQMFVKHALANCNTSSLIAVQDLFGVRQLAPNAAYEELPEVAHISQVEVESIVCPLTEEQHEHLKTEVDPLAVDGYIGMELYKKTCSFCRDLFHQNA